MSKPKYLPIPKKVPYNIRLPKKLLDELNVYAELTGKTTTDVVIAALNNFIKDKTVYNTYLSNVKGISINLPILYNEKVMFMNNNVDVAAYDSFTDEFGFNPTVEAYEILKIPNNLDVFNESFGYITPVEKVTAKGKHSGIEFAVIPDYYSYYDNMDDVFGALYCLYFEVEMDKLKTVKLIDSLDAINKANDVGNATLKNNLISCVKELRELETKVADGGFDGVESAESGVDNVIFGVVDELEAIAEKYNTGNIIPLGENIGDAVVTAKVNENPEYFDVFMDDVKENAEKIVYDKIEFITGNMDDMIADKVADIVDFRLSNIEKLVRNAKSKDEILTAIENNKIKTNK